VQEPTAGQGQVRLDSVKLPAGFGQRGGIFLEEGTFVEQAGPLDPVICVH
jgi:hypothetical protein